MNSDINKLKITKFKFDESLISYESLVSLLETNGFLTKFIMKPIEENLKVHSLYITPDLEVTYLTESIRAEEHYENAGHSCVSYREITLYEVLTILGYCNTTEQDTLITTKTSKKKFIHIEDSDGDSIYLKKKLIKEIRYYKNGSLIHISTSDDTIVLEDADYDTYKNLIEQL